MSFLDKEGRVIGNDCDYEYVGKIGKQATPRNESKAVIVGYIVAVILFGLGVFMLVSAFMYGYLEISYLYSSLFLFAFSIYIAYRIGKFKKKCKEMKEALDEFERKQLSNRGSDEKI